MSGKNKLYKFKPFCFETITYHQDGKNVPKARSGHRIVATETDIYSFGGYNPHISDSDDDLSDDVVWAATKPLFRELWKFSYVTREWSKLQTSGQPPNELASHCAALVNDRYFLVYGGTGVPFGHSSSNKLYACDLKTNEWNLVQCDKYRDRTNTDPEEFDYPTEQYGQGMTSDHHGHIYLVGGTTGFHYTIDVHKLDLKTRLWQNLYHKDEHFYFEFPEERYRHEVVLFDNKLVMLGGGTGTVICYSLAQIPVFDLQTRQWMKMQTQNDLNVVSENGGYPKARRCHDCVLVGKCVFIIGGYDGSTAYSDIWRLDLPTLQWTKMWTNLPRALYFHSAAISPTGRLSVFGGVTHPEANERSNELFTSWMKIPDLKEIAFEAFLFYVRKSKSQCSNDVLSELGLPSNLMQRFKRF